MKWPTLLVISIFPLMLPESLVTGINFDATAGSIDEGCFQLGKPSNLQPPSGNYKLSEITPYKCVMLCSVTKQKLAGLTSGELCVCSDTVAGQSSGCNLSCPADSSLNCGGLAALKVYNLSMLVRNKPKFQFSGTPTFLQKGQYQVLAVNETTGYQYQLAYKATGFINATTTNLIFGNSYSYRHTAWGSDVQLTIVVLGKVRQEFHETVEVHPPLKDSSIKCPQFVTDGLPFTCTGRLNLGKDVNMTWSWRSGELSGSINFADPVSWYIGEPVPRWTISDPGAHSLDGFVIILTTGVTHPVIVYAWEMSVQKSGTLDIVVLRPSCGVGTTYCPVTSSCCEVSRKFSSEQCNEETSFCGTSTLGVNSGNCSSSDVNNPVPLFNNYTVYTTFSFNVDVGHNVEVLPTNKTFEYLPGDIIGWMKTSSSAELAVDPSHGEYIVIESITSLPTSNILFSQSLNKTKGTVLFAGIASKPTEFVVNITAPSTHGNKNISFAHKTKEEAILLTLPVSVLYPVGNVSFTEATNSCSIYGPLNEAFNISITFRRGTEARVAWKVSNFSVASSPYKTLGYMNETTWKQNFTFSRIDEYPLVVLVTNGVSGKLLTATVIIQDKISGIKAFKANKSKMSYQGFETKLNVSISAGTNVTYKWYFGDGSDVVVTTEKNVDHIYHKFGTINTTVEATNMVSSVNFSFLVNVSNPVEITVPPFAVFNVSSNITCELVESGLQMYAIVLQIDNDSLVSSNCNTIQYVFTPGLHDIHCYIHKTVVLYSHTSLFVVEPITGLSILYIPPLALNASHEVEANITSGNNVSYVWRYGTEAYDAFFNRSYSITFKTLSVGGHINLTVTALNAVSKKSAYRNVTVQQQIGKVNVKSSSNPAKTNSNISFDIERTMGSEVKYTVNISTTDYEDLQSSPAFTRAFSQEGSYSIFISATNLISSSNTTYIIIVQDPVILPLNITCPSILREDKTCVVLTKKQYLFKAEIPYATNPTFEWKWGDDNNSTDYSPRKAVYNTITSNKSKSFSDFQRYRIVVVAKNDVSNVTEELIVATLHEVTGFTFKTPKAVAVNTDFVIHANVLQGSNVTYTYDAGVERGGLINVTNQTASWNYTSVGVYQIKGTASNLLSSKSYLRQIFVQRKITRLEIEKVRTIETNNPTFIKWNVTGDTTATSIVTFGDGSSKNVSYSECDSDDLNTTYICSTSKSWSKAEIYTVRIEAKNSLSTKKSDSIEVTVQDPVRDFTVKINESFKSQAGPGKFYVNEGIPLVFKASGTGVKFKIYLNDEHGREEESSKRYFTIEYYTEDKFYPKFVAYNDISQMNSTEKFLNISIVKPPNPVEIKGLKISAKPTIFNETTKIEIEYEEGAVFSCSIDFGDNTNKEDKLAEKNLKQGASYKYKTPGKFKAKLTCKNTGDSPNTKIVSTDVSVHVPIVDFELLISSIDAIYRDEINIPVSWKKGSHMNVYAFVEQNSRIHAAELRYSDALTNNGSGIIILPGNYFSAPGHYAVRINASNSVSQEYKELIVHIYEKIDGAQVLFNPYVSVNYSLKAYVTVNFGSEMKVTWSFGDGSPESFSNCTWKQTCSFDHTYDEAGEFLIKVVVENKMGAGKSNGTIKIEHPIVGYELSVEGKSIEKKTTKFILKNGGENPLPSNATYEIKFDQDSKKKGDLLTQNISIPHKYPKSGCYYVTVKMKNNVSRVLLELQVKVQGNYVDAVITAESLSGNKNLTKLPLEYPVNISSNVNNNCLKYNWTIKKENSTELDVNHSKSFLHKFKDPGRYVIDLMVFESDESQATIKATKTIEMDKSVTGLFLSSNGVGQVNRSVEFILLWATLGTKTGFEVDYKDGSKKELLDLQKKTKEFQKDGVQLPFDPKGLEGIYFSHNFTKIDTYEIKVRVINSPSHIKLYHNVDIEKKPCYLPKITIAGVSKDARKPTSIPYGAQYTLFGTYNADCQDSIGTEWKIFKTDEYLLQTINSSVIPPDKDKEITRDYAKFPPRNQSSLLIRRNALDPGLYQFQLEARFKDTNKQARSQEIVYIKFKRPPLVVVIEGGSARSIVWNKPFYLNANDSMDPLDSKKHNKDLDFQWRCTLKGREDRRGGCFGGGKVLSFRKGERNTNFRSRLLLEGEIYQFTVMVSDKLDKSHNGTYTQEINAIPGKPPELKLRCVSNCAAKVNPEARLSITSDCLDNCDGLKYIWTLASATSNQTSQDIWPNRTLTLNTSASLVVKAGTFQLKKEYIFKLTVENDAGKDGFVSYKVVTNSPPVDGNCIFTPSSGIARKTNFSFSCSNWTDDEPDSVLSYKAFYYFGVDEEKQSFLLYHGPKSTVVGLTLPAAPDEYRNIFNLSIHVEDSFKAYSSVHFAVTVKPAEVDFIEVENSSKKVDELIKTGNVQAANMVAIALIKGIDDKNSTTHTNNTRNTKKEEGSTDSTDNSTEGEIKKEVLKIVGKLVDNLPEDLDSQRQIIDTLPFAMRGDVPQETQKKALDACLKTSTNLENEAVEDIGNVIIEDTSLGLTKLCGNVLAISSQTQARIREKQKNNETVPPENTDEVNHNVGRAFQVVEKTTDSILKKKVPNEKGVLMKTEHLEFSLRRASSELTNGSSVQFSSDNNATVKLPDNLDIASLGGSKTVDIVGLFIKDNPYQTSDSNTSAFVDSSSISLELKQDGTPLKVQNLSDYLTIVIPRKVPENENEINNDNSNRTNNNKTKKFYETRLDKLLVHVLKLSSVDNAFVVGIESHDNMTNFTMYFRREEAPTLKEFAFNRTFNINSTEPVFLGNETINGLKYYVGVASNVGNEAVRANYTFISYQIGCHYYDEKNKSWITDGCKPDRSSTKELVRCLCNHATLFGSNFLVAPNKLDVAKQIDNLANLADYPALLATICVIGGFYLLGMIWALRKDRKKSYKTTLHCAADNEPYDNFRYEVTLFTGSRRNAGSTAEVSLIITGDNGDSEPRLLQRTSSVSFKRTSQDSYLVTTAYSLGSLQYIRIWHDNSGPDPSWFLSEVIIRDVESGEQYFFLCNSWLACDEGDGLVERLIPVAGPEELKDFQYLFMQNTTQGFSDGHLWFSIILRPAQSRFTHAQRVTCCLCLLLCTMLVNAMFFKVPVAAENNVDVDVGPYQFTWHEIMVGIQSSLIVFPINLLIVSIFRRIAARPTKSSKYLTGGSTTKPKKTPGFAISLGDIEMDKNRKKNKSKNQGDQTPQVETQAMSRMRLLPWWFVFIAWFLVIATSITAAFFTLLYGIQFGKRRQEQWLTALAISVSQDILVSQPIKIFALSLFVAFVIKKPNNVDINEENDKLMKDERWIQESLHNANPDGKARVKTERKPPDELKLKKVRLFRQKERKMFGVCREVIQFFFFWWIVLLIAYGHREPDAHRLSTSMEKTFTDLGNDSTNFAFKRGSLKHDIFMTKNKKDLLNWIREVIIPGLSHEEWYNNMTDKQGGYISDGVGYLIGSPRLRLLRIKEDTCDIAKELEGKIDGCEAEYSFSDEYREKYNAVKWVPSNMSAAGYIWQYRTQTELYERPYWAELATYRGGGYVLKLDKRKNEAIRQINELNDTWWIDGKTRAVFVEFTLFYPGKNLHCIITILFECPASGGCSASFQIQATRLDELIGNYRIFVLACELVFIISIAVFTYKTLKDMVNQGAKYWYQFWNWIEMSTIAVGWTCLAFYILRFIANKWTKAKFNDDPDNFVSFRYVATADQLYGVVIAFLVFLTSIKFLRLFRFNRRMSLLGSTLKYAAWDMFNFLILFAVAFIACVSVAYLLFQTNIDMFSSILSTTEALLNIILGKFKYMNLSHDTFVASAVVLAVYCIVVVFLLMNVFLVILNDSFKVVKGNNDLQENEYEIVDYMAARFKSWLGFRNKPSPTISDFEHEYGFKPTYVSPLKKKYEIPATAILDRKMQELLDFVEKQEHRDVIENMRVDQFEDNASKKKALLLLMS